MVLEYFEQRFGTEPNQHGIIGSHVHQSTRNTNPNNGVITGKPGSKTKNDGGLYQRQRISSSYTNIWRMGNIIEGGNNMNEAQKEFFETLSSIQDNAVYQ